MPNDKKLFDPASAGEFFLSVVGHSVDFLNFQKESWIFGSFVSRQKNRNKFFGPAKKNRKKTVVFNKLLVLK